MALTETAVIAGQEVVFVLLDILVQAAAVNAAVNAFNIFGCSKETRAWIEGKVFACKLGKPDEQTPTELPAPTQAAVPEKPTPPPKAGSDAINRRIDAILLELLELKKYIVTAEA